MAIDKTISKEAPQKSGKNKGHSHKNNNYAELIKENKKLSPDCAEESSES